MCACGKVLLIKPSNWFMYIYFDDYIHILLMQLSRCVEEFETLVNLSFTLLDGQEPTAAILFGPEGAFS